MKLIHCADLHLDSPLTSGFPGKMAVERKSELLVNIFRLADRASAGDFRHKMKAPELTCPAKGV